MNNTDNQEYYWEILLYLENYGLCFTPNGICNDLDIRKTLKQQKAGKHKKAIDKIRIKLHG